MKISRLFPNLEKRANSKFKNLRIKGISCNSKRVRLGFLFVAIIGNKDDGRNYIDEAIKKGARAVLKQSSNESIESKDGIIFINVKDIRARLSGIAAKFYGYPSKKIKIIGITGTNGKTTTAYIIEKILSQAGFNVGLIGTVNYKYNGKIVPATNTTPDSLELQSLLSKMVEARVDYCVMEVSSHALDQKRVANINFSSAIFTNLTQDHLDYHWTIEKYFLSKQRLFKDLKRSACAFVNKDDSYSSRLLKNTGAKKITYGIRSKAQVTAKDISLSLESSLFSVETARGKVKIKTGLIGLHNVYNILAAISLCVAQKIDLNTAREAIATLKAVPGRLESINCSQHFKVFVDYAHTEDALKNVLSSLRLLRPNRVILVFGCGGERDKGKRPKMGRVAARLADRIILTSDNSRSENPRDIIKDIKRGMKGRNYKVILDRKEAIRQAISIAKRNDIVLIAGKGHESIQIFKDKTMPFDDKKIVRKILRCLP